MVLFKRSFCILILVILMVFAINTSAKKWTFMVYLDADNNLEPAGLDDFIEMAMVGSTADFDIVVQLDLYNTANEYGWDTCKRFHITQGMTPTTANAVSDIGEVNMGDPDTLVDFCKWTHDNYPSDNYFLVLWDHGDGWRTRRTKSRGACTDDHGPADPDDPADPYYLNFSNGELQAAFNEITTYTGGKWSGVGFDVCLDGMWENMVACEPYFDYFVASEMSEWNEGWSYWPFLEDLDAATGDLTGQQFADAIVDAYADGDAGGCTGGTNNTSNPSCTGDTLSSIDLSQIPALNSAIDALAQELMCARDGGYSAEIDSVRNATFEVDSWSPYNDQIDLYDFCLNIQSSSFPASVKTAAANVQTAHGNAVTNNFAESAVPDNHGIAIYYSYNSAYETIYDGTDIVPLTLWENFLKGEGCPVPLNISYTSKVIDDSAGDGNGSVDPGETINLAVTLSNGGTDQATTVSATLSTLDTYVTITQNSSTYPNIASGGSETSNTDYTFDVDGSCPAGHEITFVLDISADTGYTNTSAFTIKVGETSFDSTDTPIAITDNSTITSTISVPNNCTISDIFVDVDITHTYKGDLIVILESPLGKRIFLHNKTGSGTDNIQTSYDDVTTPDGPGTMSDLDGDGSFGDWKLIVSDNAGGDTGTLNSWRLVMFLNSCSGPAPILVYDSKTIDDSSGDSDGTADPGETISMPVTLKNNGNLEATNVSAVISTIDTYITINDDTASYSNIASGGVTQESTSPHFNFSISPSCPSGHTINFDIDITSDEGSWSDSFTVDVLDINQYTSGDTPIVITDNNTITSIINVPADCDVSDLTVDVDITHTYKGDLIVILESPIGTRVYLHNKTGSGTDDIITNYDDTTTPDGPGIMDDFNGEAALGDWKLVVSDNASSDTGQLNSWTLNMSLTNCSSPGDTTAPADVSDLSFIGSAATTITLEWTVPGDDDWSGTATAYDFRYSESDINNDTQFNNATQCSDEPTPVTADGTVKQTYTISGLEKNKTYYFAMKTRDEENNWSARSNTVSGSTGVIYAAGSTTQSYTPGDGYHITDWQLVIHAVNTSVTDSLTGVTATVIDCDTWVIVIDDTITFSDFVPGGGVTSGDVLEFDLTNRPGDVGNPTTYIDVWFNFAYTVKGGKEIITLPFRIEIPKVCPIPVPPSDVAAEQILEHVRLTWSYKGSSEPHGFNIYKKIADSEWEKINEKLITKYLFKDKAVKDNVRYSYKVTAVQFDIESGFSEVAKIKINVDYEDIDHIQTYPNPAKDKIVFNRLPKDARITLYTLAGQEVITLYANGKNNIEWYLLNKAGKKVSAGIYFFVIESSKGSKKGKLAIVK